MINSRTHSASTNPRLVRLRKEAEHQQAVGRVLQNDHKKALSKDHHCGQIMQRTRHSPETKKSIIKDQVWDNQARNTLCKIPADRIWRHQTVALTVTTDHSWIRDSWSHKRWGGAKRIIHPRKLRIMSNLKTSPVVHGLQLAKTIRLIHAWILLLNLSLDPSKKICTAWTKVSIKEGFSMSPCQTLRRRTIRTSKGLNCMQLRHRRRTPTRIP